MMTKESDDIQQQEDHASDICDKHVATNPQTQTNIAKHHAAFVRYFIKAVCIDI
jgi:hypothetical protein